jgi:xanthine dehydrogenase/oxidase
MTQFFLGYRKTALEPTEVLTSLFVPWTRENEYTRSYKQAKRRDDDIAIVNACFRIQFNSDRVIQEAVLAYGGMGATTLLAKKTGDALVGKKLSLELPSQISSILLQDLPLQASSPGGQIQYRKTLSQSFFYKFIVYVMKEINTSLDPRLISCIDEIHRPLSCGEQVLITKAYF